MTRTTPELAPPSPNFHATPTGGRLTTTYDLTCNRPLRRSKAVLGDSGTGYHRKGHFVAPKLCLETTGQAILERDISSFQSCAWRQRDRLP
ncbi:hypothetical protein AVEN_143805-1 [Araneus ventricosus]|uniref:Uncharacterized protein n=1 Tax=Araneus ventricosus TaxID=182803 RepID=A0A4Y2MG87_ARAVE|nr:hypothetical protein AVEN_143805-1 [Araneus ventricosus]